MKDKPLERGHSDLHTAVVAAELAIFPAIFKFETFELSRAFIIILTVDQSECTL